jgi:chaperonin GroEL
VVKVGGATESELAARRERASGAARAVRAAATGGILPGGGAALAHASKALAALPAEGLAQRAAIAAVRRALLAPAQGIAVNLGLDGRAVVARLLASDDPAFGFDATTRRHGDLLDAGVVDATPVVCAALRNAASTAARLLGSEAAIASRRAAG